MELYLAGAEHPVYLRKLNELGVKHVAISFYEWQRRHTSLAVHQYLPDDVQVCITAGVARKLDMDFLAFAHDYIEFCEYNAEQALVFDMDSAFCPPKLRLQTRNMLAILPNTVIFPLEDEELSVLAKQHERIGVNANVSKSVPASELRRLPATLYGSNVTNQAVLRTARFAATTTMTWLSPRRYGELWVFARNKMHHYPAERLERAVRAHREDIEALGVDPDKCAENDRDVMTELAVRSFQIMINNLSKRPRDRKEAQAPVTSPDPGSREVLSPEENESGALMAENGALTIHGRERIIIPVLGVEAQVGQDVLHAVSEQFRVCDTCYLRDSCPEYKPRHACAFELPVEIKTPDQWEAAVTAILEWQFQRIAFSVFSEQIEGGGAAAGTGREMDRFLKLLGQLKELRTDPIPESGGILSQVFGDFPQLAGGEEDAAEEDNEVLYEEDLEEEISDVESWLSEQIEGTEHEGGENSSPS